MAETLDAGAILADVLTEHGPLHEDDLVHRLQERGVHNPDAILDQLLDEIGCPASQLVDDRWVWLPAVLAGRVFTHRLSADEVTHDLLTVTPDLEPIIALCGHERYRRLADGSPALVVLGGFDAELLERRGVPAEVVGLNGALLLAPGTLAALGAVEGDLVGVRPTDLGLSIDRVTATAQTPTLGARLGAICAAEEPVHFDAAVWTACAEDPAVFTEPLAPLSELVDEHGLAHYGEWLAPGGFDFARWRFERGCATLAERHALRPDDAFALYTLLKVYDQMSLLLMAAADAQEPPEDPTTTAEPAEPRATDSLLDLVGTLGAVLADPRLAELLVAETVGAGRAGAGALGLLAEALEPRVPRPARVACRWLRAVALERVGDLEAAERDLLAAESMDPGWPLPLLDLARIASDRGDAERGLALLRRAGAEPDHPLAELLARHRSEPRHDLGRNQPCWCGSGRKYKKCHLGRERLPLAERAGWLYGKAIQHALLGDRNGLLLEAGYERCRYTDDSPDALATALGDPLVIDTVLFEGGAFAEFVAARGSLLPDDERLLAEQWLLVERSVFEVERVQPGQGVTVRDVRTGDRHEVRERVGSRHLRPRQLICTRVLPVGDGKQFFGGLEPVALHERDPLIELLDTGADAVTLVAQLSRRFAPPGLANTEGDPLTICEARVRPGDPEGITAVLDDTYDRVEGEEPPCWFEHVTTQGMQRIRATLVLDGDTLRVETNSEKRMDRVLSTLARLDPAMTVLADTRHPLRNTREAAELARQLPITGGQALDPEDPEIAAALDEFIRDYEAKWLDEPIPALAGHTPRQAADDPTRRADLIRLLDTFPAGEAARGGMDADRLRDALGLR
ncbi:MAG: SEC-C domain-containing protein [Mycobacterium sp.]|uniref:SEC-C domain-containing protein n=1 Tax=Mycobacterium sp. TaxID=1785 RepID=UPI00260C955F|nr:SEC-C domain-containing protein [Mycobacterium sp.]MDI3315413.1 SEC-C domain-containing protein [Mycobacterium sp.]